MYRVGIVVPDRGDRPEFLKLFNWMLFNQTYSGYTSMVVSPHLIDPTDECDITKRYRYGYEKMNDVDVILFMENDDWYAPDYIERMVNRWVDSGKPDLFGLDRTVYYNVIIKKYKWMFHPERSSAMCMMIKPNLDITWPADSDPYTDQWLWMRENVGIKSKKVWKEVQTESPICIGIKHGIGKTGGWFHTNKLDRYNFSDDGFLEKVVGSVDPVSYQFYLDLNKKLNAEI